MSKLSSENVRSSIRKNSFEALLDLFIIISLFVAITYVLRSQFTHFALCTLFIVPLVSLVLEIRKFKNIKKTSGLKELETIIDKDIIRIISFLIAYSSILLFLLFLRSAIESIPYYFVFIFLTLLYIFAEILSSIFLRIWNRFYFLDLKKKVILHVYLSFQQMFIVYFILSSTYLFFSKLCPWSMNKILSQTELVIPTDIKDLVFNNENLISALFASVVFLIMIFVNIKINNWRINRRFEHIVDMETENLEKDKNRIIERIKFISTLALKDKHNEKQYWRVFILKHGLERINSEIEEISQFYSIKKTYIFKISLISIIYVLGSLLLKILLIVFD